MPLYYEVIKKWNIVSDWIKQISLQWIHFDCWVVIFLDITINFERKISSGWLHNKGLLSQE